MRTKAPRADKVKTVSALTEVFSGAKGAVLTEYRGLTVSQISELRTRLRPGGGEYHVVKNTLFKRALGDQLDPDLEKLLAGPTAIAFAREDIVTTTKSLLDYFRELRRTDIIVKGGYVDGKVFSPDDYGASFFVMTKGETKFVPGKDHQACKAVPVTIARNEGDGGIDQRQKAEWFRMIRGGAPAYSNFDIAAYLTEIILLGCVAMNVGVGKKLDWDGPKMRAKNNKDAEQFVKREYRKGWTLG